MYEYTEKDDQRIERILAMAKDALMLPPDMQDQLQDSIDAELEAGHRRPGR